MSVEAGKNTKVYVALYAEDGSLLYDKLLNLLIPSSGEYVFAKFPFEIRAAAETGILQVTTRDFNRRVDGIEYGSSFTAIERR